MQIQEFEKMKNKGVYILVGILLVVILIILRLV